MSSSHLSSPQSSHIKQSSLNMSSKHSPITADADNKHQPTKSLDLSLRLSESKNETETNVHHVSIENDITANQISMENECTANPFTSQRVKDFISFNLATSVDNENVTALHDPIDIQTTEVDNENVIALNDPIDIQTMDDANMRSTATTETSTADTPSTAAIGSKAIETSATAPAEEKSDELLTEPTDPMELDNGQDTANELSDIGNEPRGASTSHIMDNNKQAHIDQTNNKNTVHIQQQHRQQQNEIMERYQRAFHYLQTWMDSHPVSTSLIPDSHSNAYNGFVMDLNPLLGRFDDFFHPLLFFDKFKSGYFMKIAFINSRIHLDALDQIMSNQFHELKIHGSSEKKKQKGRLFPVTTRTPDDASLILYLQLIFAEYAKVIDPTIKDIVSWKKDDYDVVGPFFWTMGAKCNS